MCLPGICSGAGGERAGDGGEGTGWGSCEAQEGGWRQGEAAPLAASGRPPPRSKPQGPSAAS